MADYYADSVERQSDMIYYDTDSVESHPDNDIIYVTDNVVSQTEIDNIICSHF